MALARGLAGMVFPAVNAPGSDAPAVFGSLPKRLDHQPGPEGLILPRE
jgi:hypothetical protein